MKTRSNLRLLAFGSIFLTASLAHAADGTWNVDAASNWDDAGNWLGGTIADGIGFTAFFTQELTVDRTVTLDTARTIGNITFTDGTTSDSNLTISGANLLTLDVASDAPVINVTQADRTLTIATAVAGLDGLSKTGAGTLSLTGLSDTAGSNYSGTTTLDGGTLALGSATTAALGGGLTFGATAGSTNVSTLDLTSANASFAGPLTVQTNSASANLVTIGSGKTLTLTGAVTVGYPVASTTKLTMTGGGSLNVNAPTTTFQIGAASAGSTLDVSALASFTASVTTFSLGSVLEGAQAGNGTLVLSNTANSITATTLRVGAPTANGSGVGLVTLGTGTNVIQADTIHLGLYKGASGTMQFASQTAGPGTVTIANKAGTGAANITIADNVITTSGGTVVGLLDLRGHNSTVTANVLDIGLSTNSGAGGVTGTLSFDTGTFTANEIRLGRKSSSGTATGTGTINIGGGAFTVNSGGSFAMAENVSTNATGSATGNLNVTGGLFTSNVDIIRVGGTNPSAANITLNGGSIDMTGRNIGNATNPINLTLSAGTLKNVGQINGGGAVTKSTVGTVTLSGVNSYTGNSTVSAGTLVLAANAGLKFVIGASGVNNKITGAGTATLNGNFTLDLTGANKTSGNSWTLVDATSKSFSNTFTVVGFTEASDVWTKVDGATKWTFTEATGVLTASASSAFAAWAEANGLTGADALSSANPDGDTLTNLQEFAFGTDPKVSSSGQIQVDANGNVTTAGIPVLLSESGMYYAVFGRRADYVAAGLTYTVEFSADLSSPWFASAAGLTVLSTSGDIHAVRVPFPGLITTDNGPQKARFFRVQVSQAQ